MNRIRILTLLLSSLFLLDLKTIGKHSIAPNTLKDTHWTSQFYHYCNYYHFESDSTGFSESGQVAWSCPVDTAVLEISGNKILYAPSESFTYRLLDSILTIEYLPLTPNDTLRKKKFNYRSKYDNWVSEVEYIYSKECLIKGSRKEKI